MNTNRTCPRRRRLCSVAALLAAAVTAAGVVHADPQAPQTPDEGLLSLQFRGGTAAEFVSAIRRQVPLVNVLVSLSTAWRYSRNRDFIESLALEQ